ncbi:TPA: hypothetical protein EYP44_05720 [Candidatus Bathyarchaeota archaeon]|nr:hypothetical protein [Candidatus Bathyarchaeota archaeon]
MPKICGKIIEKIRKRYRIPRSLLPIHRGALRSAERGRSHLRRASLKKIVSKLRDIVDASDGLLADLERYCKQPFYVEPIRSIKRVQAGGGFVYDITVEDAHNFLPEGAIVASNCDIGAHHNRAWAIIDDIEMGREKYDEGKARRVIYLQHLRPLYDCLGVCRFMWIEFHVDPDYYVKAYAAATGVETSLTRLLEKMEMIWNLVRCISVRRGMEGSEDWLPRKVFEEPVPSGRFKGAVLDEARFERLLRTYYKLRGWTRDGVPTQRRLKRLGLIDIADDYEALRKPSSPRDSGKHGAGVAEGNDRVSVQR